MSKVLLCIPPDYDYNFPPLATPVLCAFLKHKGINASQTDLNLAYRDFLVDHIRSPGLSRKDREAFSRFIVKKFFSARLKNKYYSTCLPRQTDKVSVDLPYDNNSNSSFYFTERLLASRFLGRYLEDRRENTFLQSYQNCGILQEISRRKVTLVGISIISPSQAIAGLTLGLLIKKNLPLVHVSIGGQWPTLYRRQLMERREFFACFDSMIVFEGETPLYRLVQALDKGSAMDIPNVIFKHTKTDFSRGYSEEDMDELPCPDFDGLPLHRYNGSFQGRLTLTYETSRGCYWSKCAYCVDLPLPKPSYRKKRAELVVRDMKILQKKYKTTNLMFGDPGISPRQMKEVSRQILKERVKIDWWTMARLDPGFNSRIFPMARKAGLEKINFGFESANDRVCNFVHKGNLKKRSLKIIRNCHGSGIQVDLQTMLGLPGETMEEALDTIDFLVENRASIDGVTFNVYYLTPGNHVYNHPARYGIKFFADKKSGFRFFTPFRNIKGISGQQADALIKVYEKLVEKKAFEFERSRVKTFEQSSGDPAVSTHKINFSLNKESIRLFLRKKKSGEVEIIP